MSDVPVEVSARLAMHEMILELLFRIYLNSLSPDEHAAVVAMIRQKSAAALSSRGASASGDAYETEWVAHYETALGAFLDAADIYPDAPDQPPSAP